MLQALLLDIQRTTSSNVSLRWDQVTSGLICNYPALPKPRTDQMLMIEVLVSSGTDINRRKVLVAALVEKLGEAGIDPNDIMVFFLETDRASGSFGGGRFTPPVAFASSPPMASLRHGFEEAGDIQEMRLRSPQQGICELLLKNQQPSWALMEMKEPDPREMITAAHKA